jgi:hypothetical protein
MDFETLREVPSELKELLSNFRINSIENKVN